MMMIQNAIAKLPSEMKELLSSFIAFVYKSSIYGYFQNIIFEDFSFSKNLTLHILKLKKSYSYFSVFKNQIMFSAQCAKD